MKKKQTFNRQALEIIATRYGYTIDYVRKSIRGDRVGIMPDQIKNEYKKLENEAIKAINSFANISK